VSATDASPNRPATIADYAAIFRRRIWVLIALPLLAAVVAYAVSSTQSPRYESTAQVGFDLSGVSGLAPNLPSYLVNTDSYLATQAVYARSSQLANRVVKEADVPGMTPGQFLGESSASVPTNGATVLNLSASASNPDVAARLVDAYANQLVQYSGERAEGPVRSLLEVYDARIKRARARGDALTAETLLGKKLDLETLGSALQSVASVVPHESGAAKTQPRPLRNAILGGLMGLVLALAIAFLAEALDKRVRSESEIEGALGLPLLGRLPRPNRSLRQNDALLMLEDPQGAHAETIRKLRTSLEFVNGERKAQTVMITSAGPREGKSTTIANLAIALARAGRKVALVDLDLRRPFLHTFFKVERAFGINDVIVDRVALEAALRKIALPGGPLPTPRPGSRSTNGANGRTNTEAMMFLLPAGTTPAAADELLESDRLDKVLDRLVAECDVVLIDAPPLLAVGDVLTLSTKVDAMVVAVQMGIHRRQLTELARQLQNCRATLLGYILTGVPHGDSYTYGYGYDPHVYEAPAEPSRPRTRVPSGD
jgi:succinoglycan biosynthesis transport protein ExoP